MSGQHTISVFTAISAKPRFSYFNSDGHTKRSLYPIIISLASIRLQGTESLERSLHTSADEEDDFSKLGLPAAQGAGALLKWMTEKPDPFRKTVPAKSFSGGRSLPHENDHRLKDIFLNHGRTSPARCPKSENQTNASNFLRVQLQLRTHHPQSTFTS